MLQPPATAKLAHVDDKTVAAVRPELEAGAEFPHQEGEVGRDGKIQQPRRNRRRSVRPAPTGKKPAKTSSPKVEQELWWKEIAERDDIKAILSACVPLTPEDREFLRIALIECPELRALALAPEVDLDSSDLSPNNRARLEIYWLGQCAEQCAEHLPKLSAFIDKHGKDIDPNLLTELMNALRAVWERFAR